MVATMTDNLSKSSICVNGLGKTVLSASVWERMVELEQKHIDMSRLCYRWLQL